jgi:uncharacterized protein
MKKLVLTFLILLFISNYTWSRDLTIGEQAYFDGKYSVALSELTLDAKNDNDFAQYLLGRMFMNGMGVDQNLETGIYWYTLAAEQGNMPAQYALGIFYDTNGTQIDHKSSVKWYLLAAEQGYDRAQHNLAIKYKNGEGVIQDYETAFNLYLLAGEQGLYASQASLGEMYENGYGTTKDYVYAHMWGNIASSGGNKRGGYVRDRVQSHMSSEEIFTAHKLARDCITKNYKNC